MASKAFELEPDEDIVKRLKASHALKSLKPYPAEKSPKPSAALKRRRLSKAQKDLYSDLASQGVVVGKLTFLIGRDVIDCEKGKVATRPTTVDQAQNMQSDGALFILLVANEFVFDNLSKAKFYDRFPCILFKANEANKPAKWCISFLGKMRKELNLPVLALVNCDALGIKIMSDYAVDAWLGLRPSDLVNYDLHPQDDPLTDEEVNFVKDLIKTRPEWVPELVTMLTYKEKGELDSLYYYGNFYLAEVYLPLKLLQQDWV